MLFYTEQGTTGETVIEAVEDSMEATDIVSDGTVSHFTETQPDGAVEEEKVRKL